MIYKLSSGLLFALLIAAITLWLGKCSSEKALKTEIEKQKNKTEQLHEFYLAWIDSCKNAKIVKDKIVYVDRWHEGETVKIPAAVDSVEIAKAISEKLYIKNYRGKKEFDDLTLNWHIKTYGELLGFNIESYKLNVEQHHSTAVITKPAPPQDPIIEYKYRRGWYLTGAVGNGMESWTEWKSIEGGIGYMTRKGVSFGVDYQNFDGGEFVKVRLSYYFGK